MVLNWLDDRVEIVEVDVAGRCLVCLDLMIAWMVARIWMTKPHCMMGLNLTYLDRCWTVE